jgi:hypothetical protein
LAELTELQEISELDPYAHDDLEPCEHRTDEDEALHRVFVEFFMEHNAKFQNPVGDPPPDDEELRLAQGTPGEFLKILHAISYLAALAEIEPNFAFTTADEHDRWCLSNTAPTELEPILEAVLNAFDPTMQRWEYIDENDGRITAYVADGTYIEIEHHNVETYFPSARERLEITEWLTSEFKTFEIDPSLIEATFSPLDD